MLKRPKLTSLNSLIKLISKLTNLCKKLSVKTVLTVRRTQSNYPKQVSSNCNSKSLGSVWGAPACKTMWAVRSVTCIKSAPSVIMNALIQLCKLKSSKFKQLLVEKLCVGVWSVEMCLMRIRREAIKSLEFWYLPIQMSSYTQMKCLNKFLHLFCSKNWKKKKKKSL